MEVKGKKIIVTGGAAGIGKQLVIKLLNRGAYVSALDINADNLKKLKNDLNNNRLSTYKIDISNLEEIQKFKKQYLNDNKDLDILINNAGVIQPFTSVDNLNINDIERVMNINFYGPVYLIKEFLPIIKERKEAYIVNVGSMGGFFPFPKQTAYGASKAALGLFTEGLYAELLDSNVRVMMVLPGAINTDIAANSKVEIAGMGDSNIPMTSPEEAAYLIIEAIKKKNGKFM